MPLPEAYSPLSDEERAGKRPTTIPPSVRFTSTASDAQRRAILDKELPFPDQSGVDVANVPNAPLVEQIRQLLKKIFSSLD